MPIFFKRLASGSKIAVFSHAASPVLEVFICCATSSASANLLLKLFDIWIHAAHALSKGGIRRPTSNAGSGKDGDDDDNDGDGDGSDDDKDHDDLFHPTEAEESTCWSSHGTGR